MSLFSPGYMSLVDVAKSLDPEGKVARVAELLNTSSELVRYATLIEGNLPTGNKSFVRTSLPVISPRRWYTGTASTKTTVAAVEDTAMTYQCRPQMDQKAAEFNGNAAAIRLRETIGHVEAMNQAYQTSILYGNANTQKDSILGLTPRYNAISSGGPQAQNIINAGGSNAASNTSMWLIGWGEGAITTFYPKNGKGGLQQEDLGIVDAFDANQNPYRAYAELLTWEFGLAVEDWRYAVRICNINLTDLTTQSNTQATTAGTWINKLMIRAMARIPSMAMSKPVFLASRTVKEMLSVGALDKSQNALSFTAALDQYGRVTAGSVAGSGTGIQGAQLMFQGIPVLTVDQLLSTEAVVT
jgi:hypothetical protein